MTIHPIDRLVREANPVPDPTNLEHVALTALQAMEQWREEMDTQVQTETHREPNRARRVAVAIAAAAVVLGLLGGTALLLRTEQPGLVATTQAPPPTTVPTTVAPQFDLTGTYAGELYVWLDDIWGPNVDATHDRIPMVFWLDLAGDGDTDTGELVVSRLGSELLLDGRFTAEGSPPRDDPGEVTRLPVVDVVAAGDQVTVTWDPTVGPIEDSGVSGVSCRFEQVALTFTAEESGDRLALASGSFTRGQGCDIEGWFGPIPFESGSIVRGAAPMP